MFGDRRRTNFLNAIYCGISKRRINRNVLWSQLINNKMDIRTCIDNLIDKFLSYPLIFGENNRISGLVSFMAVVCELRFLRKIETEIWTEELLYRQNGYVLRTYCNTHHVVEVRVRTGRRETLHIFEPHIL